MAEAIGRSVDIGIAKESVRGTAVVPTFFLPQMALTWDEQIEQVIDESSVGVVEDSIDANVTEKFVEGTLEGRISVEGFGLLLLNTIGSVSTSVDTPDVGSNTHIYSVLQSAQHPSLTISVADPQGDLSFPLAMINSMEIEVALNEYIQYSADIRARAGEAATLTPVYVAADEKKLFVPQNGTFKVASTLAGLGAGTEHLIKNFTLSIEKNVEDDLVIGDVSPNDILNKQFAVEGSVELLYRDKTFIDDLLADTKQAMRLTLENTAVTIGVAANPKLEIDLANVSLSEVTKPYVNDDLIVQTLTFKAHYSLADAEMIKVTLINETPSY